MNNIYLKDFDRNNIGYFRLTKDGYFKLKHNYKDILKNIYSYTSNHSLSYNEIIIRSYDFLEKVLPGFFNFFCNLYYIGEVIDIRVYPITQKEKNRWIKKLESAKTNTYINYFYDQHVDPILYITSDINNDVLCPIGINCIFVLLAFILDIVNTSYDELITNKKSFIEDPLTFKRGLIF